MSKTLVVKNYKNDKDYINVKLDIKVKTDVSDKLDQEIEGNIIASIEDVMADFGDVILTNNK